MKSPNPKASPSPPRASSTAETSVAEALEAIDTSVLDRLLGMRQEQLRIEEFRERANQMKDSVDPLVWQRVVSDYQTRLSGLESEARPLKAQARKEFAKLRIQIDRITADANAAQVAKAELDFRHAVGELDATELNQRLQGPVGVIERCEQELATVGAIKTRFVDAFGAEDDLDTPPVNDESESRTTATANVAATPAKDPEATPSAVEAADATSYVMVEDLQVEATIMAVNVTQPLPSSAGTVAPDPAATMLHAAADLPAGDAGEEHTFLLAPAGLVINPEDPSPQEYRLAAINYIGRADDSHLQIARPGVSRRHAVIMAANGGFVIQDLGSQNGVFVNGNRISEHMLKDGEQIVIGDSTLLYRTPWPPAGRRESRSRATRA